MFFTFVVREKSTQYSRPNSRAVDVCVDFARRFDHMQHHTAQHLISALALKLYGFRTLSWQLSKDLVTIEMNCEKKVMEQYASALEVAVNEKIRDAIAVTSKELSLEEMRSDETLRASSKKFPDGISKLRVVRINGVDANPCCGTHVRNLSHMQMVKFSSVTKRGKGSVLGFRAGERILRVLQRSALREAALTGMLNCAPDDHATRVKKILSDTRTLQQKLKRASDEIAIAAGREAVSCALTSNGFARIHRDDGDMKYLKHVVTLAKNDPSCPKHYLFFATCGVKGNGNFMLAGEPAIVKDLGPKVANQLQGRGGGRSGLFQGKVSAVGNATQTTKMIVRYLKNACVSEGS